MIFKNLKQLHHRPKANKKNNRRKVTICDTKIATITFKYHFFLLSCDSLYQPWCSLPTFDLHVRSSIPVDSLLLPSFTLSLFYSWLKTCPFQKILSTVDCLLLLWLPSMTKTRTRLSVFASTVHFSCVVFPGYVSMRWIKLATHFSISHIYMYDHLQLWQQHCQFKHLRIQLGQRFTVCTSLPIIMLHHMHRVQRCGILLLMFCGQCACLSVGHNHELC